MILDDVLTVIVEGFYDQLRTVGGVSIAKQASTDCPSWLG